MYLSETLLLQHVEVGLLATLAGLALLLSSVGIYGLVSNLVNQRTRELGIRMALGCTVRGAMFEVSRTGIAATGAGLAAGLLLSFAAVKALRSQLFGVALYDPLTLCAVSALLASGRSPGGRSAHLQNRQHRSGGNASRAMR